MKLILVTILLAATTLANADFFYWLDENGVCRWDSKSHGNAGTVQTNLVRVADCYTIKNGVVQPCPMVANPAYRTWLDGVGAAWRYDPRKNGGGDFDTALVIANAKLTNEYASLTQGERDGIKQDIGWMNSAKILGSEPPKEIAQ